MLKQLVEKYLALCQALTTNNHSFSFSLTMGSDIFTFSTKELVKSSCGKKKKKSPSQLRREERRRQERKRAASVAEEDAEKVSAKSSLILKCNHCETKFNSEEELIAHSESVHVSNSTALCYHEKECEISTLTSTRSTGFVASHASSASVSFRQDVGTKMCPVCDFDMCFPNLDSIAISCRCSLGEDS